MTAAGNCFSLEGRNILLTGAGGHLGCAMARALAEAGATVWLNGRSAYKIEALTNELRTAGYAAQPAVFDVLDSVGISAFFKSLGARPLHVLINNAYAGSGGTIATADIDAYASSYALVVGAAQALTVTALPALLRAVDQSADASVINIGSMYGIVSPNLRVYDSAEGSSPPFYGAAKAALLQWTRYAACEFGPKGIRVNAISPGPFPADSIQESNPAFIRRLEQKVPLGRIGRAKEIGGPLVFLASPAASFINGANLVVDGGWTIW